MNDLISFGKSSNLSYNFWNRFLAVFSVLDLKIKLIFFTSLSSRFNLLVHFFLSAFFSLNSLFNFLFSWLSFCLFVSSFRVLPFCPLYFSLISFISFSNYFISVFNFFILLLSTLCFFISLSIKFFIAWNVHL